MRRKIEQSLVNWAKSDRRKPLLINGARQVGKSYILEWLGQNCFDNYVRINLETMLAVRQMFDGDISPCKVIRFIESVTSQRIIPGKTLVILDEIQSSERALMSLKMFCEEAPEYAIAAAGSLLGVAINRENYSFPVGKVNEINLFPFDFEEFLWAIGKEVLADQIREHFLTLEPVDNAMHQLALDYYRQYLIVGGMPAAVKRFVETGSFMESTIEQQAVLNDYVADMAKYTTGPTAVKVRACYNSIPVQLAKENKKFQYKVVKQGGSAGMFGESIDWLIQSGTVLKCDKVTNGFMPLAAYVDMSDFKIYMSDVGLLTLRSGMAHQTILGMIELETDNTFMGGLVENYVAQAFAANGIPLYYWKNDNRGEVDFVMQDGAYIIPVEVKSGRHTKSVSMNNFMKAAESPYALRISAKNFGSSGNIHSVPLYAVFCIEKSIG